jgi:hypothetical protein
MFKNGARKVKAFLGHYKNIIKHPGSLLVDIVMAGDKQLAEDIVAIADLFGKGDEVGNFLGVGGSGSGAGAGGGHSGGHGGGHSGGNGGGHGGGHGGGGSHGGGSHGQGHGGELGNSMGRPVEQGPDGALPEDGMPAAPNGDHTPASPGGGQSGSPGGTVKPATIGPAKNAPLISHPAAANDGAEVVPGAARIASGGGNVVPLVGGIGAAAGAVAIGGGVAAMTTGGAGSYAGNAALDLSAQEMGLPANQLYADQQPDFDFDGAGDEGSSDKKNTANDVAVSRAGGLAPEDVVTTVSYDSLGFMQSPVEGQMMIVPTSDSVPPSPAVIEQAMVNAQMNGEPVEQAIASTLGDHGYGVYHRSGDDALGGILQLLNTY